MPSAETNRQTRLEWRQPRSCADVDAAAGAWDRPTITADWIAGPLPDMRRLAGLVETARVDTAPDVADPHYW